MPDSWITTLFLRFDRIWGEKWARYIPNEIAREMAAREWGEALVNIPRSDIANAIEHCRQYIAWPPSIAEFIEYCQPAVNASFKDSSEVLKENRQREEETRRRWNAAGMKAPQDSREEMREEVELGGRVCHHIKAIFYPDKDWVDVAYLVADKFTELKQIMYKAYPDRKRYDIVKELATYSKNDIEDAFG